MPSINSPLAITDSHSLSRDCAEFSTSQAPHRKNNPSVRELIEYIEELEALVSFYRGESAPTFRGLTNKETLILLALYRRSGLVAKECLWTALYDDDCDAPEIKIVDVFVCKLRAKLPPDCIETVWGKGYVLTPAGRQWAEENEVRW